MICISISGAAFEAIAATLLFGSAGFERELDAKGKRQIWYERSVLESVARPSRPWRELQRHDSC
jgi:hypothetical protein